MFLNKFKENLSQEKYRCFPWIPVLYGLGIGIYFSLSFEPPLWLGLVFVESLILLAVIFRHKLNILYGIGIMAIVVLGFITVQLRAAYINKVPFVDGEQKLYIQGRIVAQDINSTGKVRLLLDDVKDFDEKKLHGLYKITLLSRTSPARTGQCVEMIAKIMPPMPPVIRGGYQFDRKTFFEGIKATGYSVSRALPIECANTSRWTDKLNLKIHNIRQNMVNYINQVLPKDEASIAAAVIAGERSGMSKQLVENYRDSGLAHFLSISGLHMSMLAGMMFLLVRWISSLCPPLIARYDTKKAAAVLAIIMSMVYLVLSGAEIPTQRAFIMTLIVLIGILCCRQAISMFTISWAAIFVLMFRPEVLIGASFQMSFAAVIALIAFYERYAGSLQKFFHGDEDKKQSVLKKLGRGIWVYILGILISDFVASVATLPFSVYHFNQIALYTTLGNLLAGPVIGLVIMPCVLISLLCYPLGIAYMPLQAVGWGVGIVNKITAYVAAMPNSGFWVPSLPTWGLVFIVFGGLWLCIWQEKWRVWGWLGIVVGSLSLLSVRLPDVLISSNGKAVAVKDNQGKMVILPSRGQSFVKNVWLEKTGSLPLDKDKKKQLTKIWNGQSKAQDQQWLSLECNKKTKECTYKGVITIQKGEEIKIKNKDFNTEKSLGASLRINEQTKNVEIKTIRSGVGKRYWN